MDPQRMYGNLHQLPEAKWKQDSVPTSKEDDGFYTNFMKPQSDGNWNQQEGRSRRHPKSIEPTRVQVSAAPPRPPKAGQNISLIDTWPSGTPTIGLDIYSPAVEAAFRSPASPEPPSTTKTGGARRTVLVLIALLGTFIIACIGLVALVLTNNAKFSEELKMLRVELSENSSHVSKDMTDFKKQQDRFNSNTDQSLRELKKDMVSKDMTGFKKQQDQINSDTDQSLQELKKKIESICLTCPVEWKWFQKSCYFFSSTARNWESARQFCLNHGSHLVIVNDREEQFLE
ncbi:C-type lectin domain family 17, member A-like isoform X2 [Ambystoma mexicanum]|uniref:C-type lectin domain family 17, member A-like isoform X2 n=1 Tax=Ambystoma mexicanum TaxID=8296 RepID=UPI0037E7FEAE